jgi:hypothetical protein
MRDRTTKRLRNRKQGDPDELAVALFGRRGDN